MLPESAYNTIREALRARRESLQYLTARQNDSLGNNVKAEDVTRWHKEINDIRFAEAWLSEQPFGKDNEIIETGIKAITYAVSDTFNVEVRPSEGWAKWFKDELGQLWVKFNRDQDHFVIPADRVREVVYVWQSAP